MMETTGDYEKRNDLDDRKKRRKEEKEKLLKEVGHLIKTRYIDGNFYKFLEQTGLRPATEKDGRLINENAAQVLKVVKKLIKIKKNGKGSNKKLIGKRLDQGRENQKKS